MAQGGGSNVRVKSTECKTKQGMVTEADQAVKLVRPHTIKDATTKVYDKIVQYWMPQVIEKDGDKLKLFYIGKTYIDCKRGKTFSLDDDTTWKLEGVKDRYKDHKEKEYCKNSLIVVAVLQDGCIPKDCFKNWCFRSHQEYALTLEARLIQTFMSDPEYYNLDDPKLSILENTGTHSGKESTKPHEASVIYITFSIEDKVKGELSYDDDDNKVVSELAKETKKKLRVVA